MLALLRTRDRKTAPETPTQNTMPQTGTILHPPRAAHGYSCLFLNTYYDRFLNNVYGKSPALLSAPYRQQKEALQGQCFGDSDFYSLGLKRAGWETDDLIINCNPLQRAWAEENGVRGEGLDLVVEQIRRARPTAVYIQDMHIIPAEFLQAIRPHTTLIAGQIASPMVRDIPFDHYDVIFSCAPHFIANYRQAGLIAYYQPLAFDARVLDQAHPVPYRQRPVACSFAGGLSNYHQQSYNLLDVLAKQTPIEFWGYGADTLPADSPIRSRHHGEAWGTEMFHLLGSSRITVNRHGEIAENFACNMRLFEATGCGTLLITDYKDNLNELFEIGKEVVAYRSPEECAALVNYYLAHPDEAEKIARAGQERTLRQHTYPRRMEQTAEILERHIRYNRERNTLPLPDPSRISWGYEAINHHHVSEKMVNAWKDESIPAQQRALVQQELDNMYHGKGSPTYHILADIIRPYIGTGDSVLEIGCSSGYCYEILEYHLNKKVTYTGVDYSDAMIDMARDYYPRANFLAADGAALPFADRQFHTVISSCVLLHTPNYRDHIAETVRVADSYVMVFRTPICRSRPTQYLKKFAYGVETLELLFNENELVGEFITRGLELINLMEYDTDSAHDSYGVTYLFRKKGR